MSPVDVRPRPAPTWSGTAVFPYVAAAVAAVVLAVVAAGLARGPAFVDEVDVVNRSPYELLVDVRGGPDDGWVRLGYVDQDGSTVVRDVLDQGGSWTFRFRTQGRDGGQLTVSRSALARAEWRIDVPDAVEARLRAAGAPPSP
jgi:hypothetical protein